MPLMISVSQVEPAHWCYCKRIGYLLTKLQVCDGLAVAMLAAYGNTSAFNPFPNVFSWNASYLNG